MNLLTQWQAGSLATDRADIITRAVGTFHFDVVTTESHDSTLRLTENPIESGAAVADHAVLEPKEITLNGVMVGYAAPSHVGERLGTALTKIKSLPIPIEIRAITAQAESMANRYLAQARDLMEEQPRALAPFLPDYRPKAADASATLDRVGKAYDTLLTLQKSGEPVEVQTGVKRYKNMMLTQIGITQTHDGAAEFTLTLREVFIVETQTAQGLHPDLQKSAPKTVNLGKTQPKIIAKDKKSAVKAITNAIRGG